MPATAIDPQLELPTPEDQVQPENDDKGYYETVVSLPTTDINEPLCKDQKKTPLNVIALLLKTGIVIYLGLRTDYPFIKGYMKHHGLYYITWVTTILALDIYCNNFIDWADVLSVQAATILILFSYAFYYIGMPLHFVVLKEPLRNKVGKAKFIMISEVLFSVMWLMLGIGFRAFCLRVHDQIMPFPIASSTASTALGAFLFCTGYIFKGWACVLTGFNSYYWRDMLTDIPNAEFVQSNLYKVFSHPTYTVGYLQGLGTAIFYRSVEACIVWAGFQISILLFVHFVEQPFIERTYNSTNVTKQTCEDKEPTNEFADIDDEESPSTAQGEATGTSELSAGVVGSVYDAEVEA